MTATADDLLEWATASNVRYSSDVTGFTTHRVLIGGLITVEFHDTRPTLVVRWGNGYRADFDLGVTARALTGFLAGLLPEKTIGYGTAVTADPTAVCTEAIAFDDDGPTAECGKPSRFLVSRSDGDTSYGSSGGTEEACEQHLADVIGGMIEGDDSVYANVRIRWDNP